jgi:serine/threonine protein kinase
MESTLISAPAAAPAAKQERFEFLDRIGRGGMGEVWKAHDRELELCVALKALRPSAARDPKLLARFRREAKLARRIKHVNVAQMFDLVEVAGDRYLCMEFVDGKPLNAILAAKRALPVKMALVLMRQLCGGVHAAHEAGVIHRDLKPHNVMVTRRHGRISILDFGIAREVGHEDLTEAGVIVGSPQYLSYEQLAGHELTPRSDIYQLGILLYELVTGVSPFRAPGTGTSALRALREVPPDPRQLMPKLHPFIADAILRCLSKHPEDRFETALDLCAALEAPNVPASDADSQEDSESLELDGASLPIGGAPTALLALPDGPERSELASRLERLGCEVSCEADGTRAVEKAWNRAFALVVLAPKLPGMDGVTACQLVRRSAASSQARVLLVTDSSEGSDAMARDAGAADVLHAPVNVHAFSRAVRRLLVEEEDPGLVA